jgi:hypothetical protein
MPRLFAVKAKAILLWAISGIVPRFLAEITTVRTDSILSALRAAFTQMFRRFAIKAAVQIVTMSSDIWFWRILIRV